MQGAAEIKTYRIPWTDYAKGIAIIFVVYRHVAVGLRRSSIEVSDWLYNIQEVVYNFRMPAFFIISGVFAAQSLQKRKGTELIKNRAQTILYPYILWGILLTLIQIFFSGYTNSKREWTDLINVFVQPRAVDHMWYLLALFNTTVLYVFFNGITVLNKWMQLAISLVLYAVSFIAGLQDFSLLTDALHFYIYFLLGATLSGYFFNKDFSEKALGIKAMLIVLPLFVAGQYFWFINRDEESAYKFPFLLISILACYFIYIVSFQLTKIKGTSWLGYLGRYSLYIYILHMPIAAILRNVLNKAGLSAELSLVVCVLAGLLIPIVMFNLLNKIGFERLFSLKVRTTNGKSR